MSESTLTLAPVAAALALGVACVQPNPAEDPSDWFDPGVDQDVIEAVEFTDQNYDFPENSSDGIAAFKQAVFPAPANTLVYGADDAWPTGSACAGRVDNDLPRVIEGTVTLFPRFYFKISGCDRASDEKYYASYFIQDRTGGVFVLGDSKVAHFGPGDHVKLEVRAVRTTYDLDMVYAHDVLEVDRVADPIYYTEKTGPMALADIALVRRVEGTVVTEMDTFGEVAIRPTGASQPCEAGNTAGCYFLQIDSDLARRGFDLPVGSRVQATGPVLYSYSQFTVVVMKRGQVTLLDD